MLRHMRIGVITHPHHTRLGKGKILAECRLHRTIESASHRGVTPVVEDIMEVLTGLPELFVALEETGAGRAVRDAAREGNAIE